MRVARLFTKHTVALRKLPVRATLPQCQPARAQCSVGRTAGSVVMEVLVLAGPGACSTASAKDGWARLAAALPMAPPNTFLCVIRRKTARHSEWIASCSQIEWELVGAAGAAGSKPRLSCAVRFSGQDGFGIAQTKHSQSLSACGRHAAWAFCVAQMGRDRSWLGVLSDSWEKSCPVLWRAMAHCLPLFTQLCSLLLVASDKRPRLKSAEATP